MKKVIISALIGALFGGAVVAFSTNNNFVNTAQAKGQPETLKNENRVIENSKVDNEIKGTTILFSTNNKDSTFVFDIKKTDIPYLDFEIAHVKNKSKNVIIKGKAIANNDNQFVYDMFNINNTDDFYIENGFYLQGISYEYKDKNCSFDITLGIEDNGLHIGNTDKCNKLKEIGLSNIYFVIKKTTIKEFEK